MNCISCAAACRILRLAHPRSGLPAALLVLLLALQGDARTIEGERKDFSATEESLFGEDGQINIFKQYIVDFNLQIFTYPYLETPITISALKVGNGRVFADAFDSDLSCFGRLTVTGGLVENTGRIILDGMLMLGGADGILCGPGELRMRGGALRGTRGGNYTFCNYNTIVGSGSVMSQYRGPFQLLHYWDFNESGPFPLPRDRTQLAGEAVVSSSSGAAPAILQTGEAGAGRPETAPCPFLLMSLPREIFSRDPRPASGTHPARPSS